MRGSVVYHITSSQHLTTYTVITPHTSHTLNDNTMPSAVAPANGVPASEHAKQAKEIQTADQLIEAIKATHTAPLWAQMAQLNPPAPNPQTVPHVWSYDTVRPYLLRAGDLITEKQAERRVLMLTNPARRMPPLPRPNPTRNWTYLTPPSRPLHHRHPLRRPAAGPAPRDGPRPPAHRLRLPLHHRRAGRLHRRSRAPCADEATRRDRDADVELARPRQEGRGRGGRRRLACHLA